ncbi:MAG: cytochrome c biogenesis protein CcsA [Flavobacteriales bacterium]
MHTAVAGLYIPLNPGLVHVSRNSLPPERTSISLTGYNTHFASCSSGNNAWLESGTYRYCLGTAKAVSETRVDLNSAAPPAAKDGMWTVVVENDVDGMLRLQNALFVKGSGVNGSDQPCPALVPMNSSAFMFHKGFPNRSILNETIRNLFFHVPMWFSMITLMAIAFVFSIKHLRSGSLDHDLAASVAVNVSLLFGTLGIVTGSIWARATWGGWWTSDTKLNGSALTLLMYLAYVILRGSVPDAHKRARLAAVYNIFAFMLMLVFIMVLPRITDSLHPGNGGNPAFSQYDLDNALRAVFYPACLGWILLGIWTYNLRLRYGRLNALLDENESR